MVVNPTTTTVNVDLGGSYTDLHGSTRTSVTLAPGAARILTKA